jgi:hypothetical protein
MELTTALPSERTSAFRDRLLAGRVLATSTATIGALLASGGLWLLLLGGSAYYVVAGVGYLVASRWLWRHRAAGAWLVLALLGVTICWALWEVGLDYWAVFPRVLMPAGLALLALVAALRFPGVMHFDERNEGDYRIYAGALEAPLGDGYIAAVVVNRVTGAMWTPREAFRDTSLSCGHRWPSAADALSYAVARALELIRTEPHRLAC